ncbi:MAG: hypothetical protein EAZ30_16665 [Betaproteobacteria bacterium]|nr:MAG: hypothetical protein EAZ30_16665 [Betaproteobacteria bacterium]
MVHEQMNSWFDKLTTNGDVGLPWFDKLTSNGGVGLPWFDKLTSNGMRGAAHSRQAAPKVCRYLS